MEVSGKGLLYFYQQASSLIGNQPNHRTDMCLSYQPNSRYESDNECICIVINGKNTVFFFKYFEQCTRGVFNKRIKYSFPYINVCQARV